MRTLLIAPHTDLSAAEREVQHVINALSPTVLIGAVTVHDVLAALSAGQYDTVWFACHGSEDGVQLSDGLLPTATLAQLLRRNTPALVVLNTCSSLPVAMSLYSTLHCAVVATVVAVPDSTAYITGTLFARALAGGASVADAYEQSLPGDNRIYVLLNGKIRMGTSSDTDDLKAMLAQAMQCNDRVHAAIESLRREVHATYQPRPNAWRNVAWFGGLLLLVLAVLLVVAGEAFGVSLREMVLVVFLLSVIAIGALAYGSGRLAV